MHSFGAQKQSLKFLRMVKFNNLGQQAGDDDAVDVSNDESSVALTIAEEAFVTVGTSRVASSPATSDSFEITSTSTCFAYPVLLLSL